MNEENVNPKAEAWDIVGGACFQSRTGIVHFLESNYNPRKSPH
jgi:hypothetical protein